MNHKERAERRRMALKRIAAGELISEVAAAMGLSERYLLDVARLGGVFAKSLSDKAAEFIKQNRIASNDEVMDEFGCDATVVYRARRLAGIYVKNRGVPRQSTFLIIADLINTDDTMEAIGERNSVTRQRVEQIKTQCVNAGISLHPVRRIRAKSVSHA